MYQEPETTSSLRTACSVALYHQKSQEDRGSLHGCASSSYLTLPSSECSSPYANLPPAMLLSFFVLKIAGMLLLQLPKNEPTAGSQSVQFVLTDNTLLVGTRIGQKTTAEGAWLGIFQLPPSPSFLKAQRKLETSNF